MESEETLLTIAEQSLTPQADRVALFCKVTKARDIEPT